MGGGGAERQRVWLSAGTWPAGGRRLKGPRLCLQGQRPLAGGPGADGGAVVRQGRGGAGQSEAVPSALPGPFSPTGLQTTQFYLKISYLFSPL